MSLHELDWRTTSLGLDSTIQMAIQNLDNSGAKIVLVIDKENKLKGTISDGDIRRGLIRGLNLNSPIESIVNLHAITVPKSASRETIIGLMSLNKIQQIPIVDDNKKIVGLCIWGAVPITSEVEGVFVIMVGGKGLRLLPHTETRPKSMVLLGGRPMLEHIIMRAKAEGFSKFILAIHHLGQMIEDYFGDGSKMGIQIQYIRESKPLGTAGALSLLKVHKNTPIIVTNGDVITDINYADLLDFHLRNQANATMAVRFYEQQNPYGVVILDDGKIIGFDEKPIYRSYINAGVYALSAKELGLLNRDEYCDMPTLLDRILRKSGAVMAYSLHESWMDVGRPDDLDRASAMLEKNKST